MPTILLDKNDLIIYMNQKALQILKHRKNQILGKPIDTIIPSYSKTYNDATKSQTLEFTTKSNLILAANCEVEFINTQENQEISFQSIQFSEYAEVGKKIDQENQQIFQQLETLMKEEQPFLNNVLQQIDIAEKLSISQRKLGEVLSAECNTTFPSYINTYRVAYAQKKLTDSTNTSSIEDIGKQSGFNSKTSFYTIFKEHTGKTPGQYRKQ
jgi:AraC-like DNA-binding protein